MDGLHFRFLGDFSVYRGSEPVALLSKPRLQSLLAYLILHRDAPQFRYHLAGVLWPDSPEGQALTNLRNLVYLLRQSLPDCDQYILADHNILQWNAEAAFSVDVLDFQQLTTQASPRSPTLDELEAAVKVYQGDLLPSCYDEWLLEERAYYRQLFLSRLDQLIECYQQLNRYPEAIAGCQRLISCEPFHKDGFSRLMHLQILNDDPISAIKTYQEYARLLKRELNLEPPAEMQALYHNARRAVRQTQSTPGAASQPDGQLPLVSRLAEWQAIQGLWKTTAAGQARMLFIVGEAGVGKTRLAEELVGWAARQGIRTAIARCYASEGALPYASVVEWLRAMRLPALERAWLSELSRLLPELMKNNTGPQPPLTEAWQRLRLFEALARAILQERQKTLLLIEDLQWCDQDTLEWLHYLLRFDPHAPLLVVGTARTEEIDTNPAFVKLLSGLRQAGYAVEIELARLDEEETNQLAAYTAGKPLEHSLGALIFQETEGNPLFIVETVRAEMFKQGQVPGVQPLPYKARAVLENRIHQLSPAARDLVVLAATIGRAFSLDALRLASKASEEQLVLGMEELLQRRIVREIALNAFDFNHDKLREAAFSGVSALRRQMLHRQVADALVLLASNQLASRNGEIASHYDEAGSAAQAIQFYQAAGEEAQKIYANPLAVQYYQRAITLAQTLQSDPRSAGQVSIQPGQLYEKLGEALALTGHYPQAQAAFEQALTEQPLAPGLWQAQLYRKISEALTQEYQRPQALAILEKAEQALSLPRENETLLDRQEWLQIQLARSSVLYWMNQPDQMDVIHQAILALITAQGRPDQQVELFSQQFMARMQHERYRLSKETVELARKKMELVTSLKDPYDTAWAKFHVGFSLLWHGDPASARLILTEVHNEAVRMNTSLLQVRCLAYLNIANRQVGDANLVREQSRQLLELASTIGEQAYQGISYANQGWLAWRANDLDQAETLCQAAVDIWQRMGGFMFTWLADWVLLASAVARNDLLSAEKYARLLLNPSPITQPILEPAARVLEEALLACSAQQSETAVQRFVQALNLVKAAGDL
jgi:DNA-binding SARP family transcriptional activator/predicted ATPase